MKFAVIEGERREAQPGLLGKCPGCDNAMIAKCGPLKVWHWAHKGTLTCDRWWEPETKWHRDWKDYFPKGWQEKIQAAEDGERHIADVKTEHGVVLEFQHSFLDQNERESREAFYPNLVWVVDGRRRPLDMPRFSEALRAAAILYDKPRIVLVGSNRCALLRDWSASRVSVFFDFGDHALWRLGPRSGNAWAYLLAVPKSLFLECHLKGVSLEETCAQTMARAVAYYSDLVRRASRARPSTDFERYMAGRQSARRRF